MSVGAFVYILASRPRGALYVGVTNDLARRIFEHRAGLGSRQVSRYSIHRLVLALPFPRIDEAIAFEKKLKKWRRAWKLALVERHNPDWADLYETILA